MLEGPKLAETGWNENLGRRCASFSFSSSRYEAYRLRGAENVFCEVAGVRRAPCKTTLSSLPDFGHGSWIGMHGRGGC